ncbi:hypothetical protein V6N13_110843 [Hibiscus sabdariffa]
MASHAHLDDDDDFGGDFPGSHTTRHSGNKRSFGDLEDDEDDIFGSKKANSKVDETAPGVATGMILSLRESLQNCKDTLATCQLELEAAKSEIQKWHSSFQNEPFIPAGIAPAAFIVTFAKREQEIAELKSAVRDLKVQLKPPSMQARRLLLDPAIHEEFTRLKNLIEEKDKKVKELQENIAAVSFTPQSKMGKILMAKCRTLQEENEEIGTQAEEGKMHELAMKLALQKSQNAELRSQFEALYKQMEGLTNDAERSNEMVYVLQEKLGEREDEIKRLKMELQQKMLPIEVDNETGLASDTNKLKDEMTNDETGNNSQLD